MNPTTICPKAKRLITVAMLSLLTASVAFGQTTPAPDQAVKKDDPSQASKSDASQDESLELPPYEVTAARRRDENLQQVPIAITTFSQQSLENNNMVVLQDIAQMVPSLTMNAGNTGIREQLNVTLRGQGVANITGAPAVGLYLNEVPIQPTFDGNLVGGPGMFFDLENIDVLKGPQGTLFGLNTIGGAVLLRTARPKNEFGGNIQVSVGNYGNREVNGVVNIPLLADKLLFRFAFSEQTRRGFSYILSSPKYPEGFDADNRDWSAFRVSLTFRPNERFENDFTLTSSRYDTNGTASFLTQVAAPATDFYPGIAAELAKQQALGARTHIPIDTDTDGTEGEFLGLQNITRVKLADNFEIKNIFGLHEGFIIEASDVDGTKFGLFNLLPRKNKTRQFTDEIQFLGKSLNDKLDWTVGAFYLDSAPPSNYYALQQVKVLYPDILPLLQNVRRETSTSQGYFSHGIYDLSQYKHGLKLNAGVRYSKDHREQLGGPINTPQIHKVAESSAWTGQLGLDYQLTSNKLVYLALRRGYRVGGADGPIGLSGAFYPYKPEYLNDLEVGIKMDWHLGSVPIRTNVALYRDLYEDMQVTQQVPNPEPGSLPYIDLTKNAAKSRLQGAEVELLARVTKSLQVTAYYSYLNFKYLKFDEGVDPVGLIASARANRVPHKYGVGARYHFPMSRERGELALYWNYNWTDATADYLATSEIPAYGIHNLTLNWNNVCRKAIDLSLFSSNVADKTYASGGIGFLGYWQKSYGEPRMYGARVRFHF